MTDDGESDDSVEVLREACAEARHTMDQQITKIHYEDRKAVGIFRVNLLVLGVIVSGISVSIRTDQLATSQFLNVHTAVGTLGLLLSSVIASMAYTSSSFKMGIKAAVVNDVANDGYTRESFLEKLGEEYASWIEDNARVQRFNSYAITWAIIFAIIGLIYFINGAIVGILEMRASAISYGLLLFGILVGFVLGFCVYKSDWIFRILMSSGDQDHAPNR